MHQVAEQLKLGDPLHLRYWHFLEGLFAGQDYSTGTSVAHCSAPCLGLSYQSDQQVMHTRASRRAARARAVQVLERVGIPDAQRRSRSRPHEFSGGMRQRALIAMALACRPDLLIADEPTTALDVTVQAQILDLLHTLREETGMGLLLVTHDVGVAAESVDEVLVMRHGRAVEHGPVGAVLRAPAQAYTRELLDAVTRVDAQRAPSEASDEIVLEATGLRREFGRGKREFTPWTTSR